jgi:tryptophanyl-tRNA synthetase
MSEDERQRQMDFILNTLAEVTTKLSALTDAQARTDATVGELAGQVQNIARQQEHINEVVAVIAESQQHTDERLNALIDIVQGGRNGKQ